jgi:glutamate synthase domain-containing protein 3
VATQDEMLEKRFQGRPEYIVNYMRFVARDLREIMAQLGVRSIDELVGRTDLLEVDKSILPERSKGIDYSGILYKPEVDDDSEMRCTRSQDHGIDEVLDRTLIELASNAIKKGDTVRIGLPISNTDRTAGAMLSGEVCRVHGESGLPEGSIHCKFNGIAGQSFGAFLGKGITFELEGMANDYVGKGASGGKIVIYPDHRADFIPEHNIIIGNTTFYGATSGEAYIRGVAGERFCIRNSGLYAVAEGVGDHGCEYMTGGRVVVIGKTGRNFAAGMSGGIAYVYDEDGSFESKCNMGMVNLERLNEDDKTMVHDLLHNHYKHTGSSKAKEILDHFHDEQKKFVKVMPVEYKRVLEGKDTQDKLGLTEVSDG